MTVVALWWFDLTRGLPTAAGVLRRELGTGKLLEVLTHFLRRSLLHDPMRALPAVAGAGDRFTRHQLRPVVLLQDVLERDLGLSREATLGLLGSVVGESGARFIESSLDLGEIERWDELDPTARRRFGERMLARFGNAEAEIVEAGDGFGFDVHRCHFVSLTTRLHRPELAPLFCRADSVFFSRPDSKLHLERATTLAGGDQCCAFRFSRHVEPGTNDLSPPETRRRTSSA